MTDAQRGDFGRLPVNAGDVRERLAEALLVWWEADAGDSLRAVPEAIDSAYEYADALVPAVDALIREGAAEALEQAADTTDEMGIAWDWRLRDRAAALRAASHTEHVRAAAAADQPGEEADEVPVPRFGWIKPPPYSHRVEVAPAPSAGQDTERLRDAIAIWIAKTDHDWTGVSWDDPYGARADSLLDGPLRQLIAERDQARAQVARVREFAEELAEDSGNAKQLADDARARDDREVQRINMRHARVAHHAAAELRRAVLASLPTDTEGDQQA